MRLILAASLFALTGCAEPQAEAAAPPPAPRSWHTVKTIVDEHYRIYVVCDHDGYRLHVTYDGIASTPDPTCKR